MATGDAAGRSTRRWREMVEELRSRRGPCWLCGQRIDYTLPPENRWAFQADHIKSWRDYPHLREDPANLAPSHRRCNAAKGAGSAGPGLGLTSIDWERDYAKVPATSQPAPVDDDDDDDD